MEFGSASAERRKHEHLQIARDGLWELMHMTSRGNQAATAKEIEMSEELTTARRERLVRSALRKTGYRLQKAPPRHWTGREYGVGYMIIEECRNIVKFGCMHRPYDATLDEVESFAAG